MVRRDGRVAGGAARDRRPRRTGRSRLDDRGADRPAHHRRAVRVWSSLSSPTWRRRTDGPRRRPRPSVRTPRDPEHRSRVAPCDHRPRDRRPVRDLLGDPPIPLRRSPGSWPLREAPDRVPRLRNHRGGRGGELRLPAPARLRRPDLRVLVGAAGSRADSARNDRQGLAAVVRALRVPARPLRDRQDRPDLHAGGVPIGGAIRPHPAGHVPRRGTRRDPGGARLPAARPRARRSSSSRSSSASSWSPGRGRGTSASSP